MNALIRPADIDLKPVLITVEDFTAMIKGGAFQDSLEKIELIDGVIVMAPVASPEHILSGRRSTMALAKALVVLGLDQDWAVQPEGAMVVDRLSMLVPDLSLVSTSAPGWVPPDQALVVIEIAWSSFKTDTGLKARKYAAAGAQEYWVVDVAAKAVIVHTGANGEAWDRVRTVTSGESIAPLGEPRLVIAVADLF